MDGYLKQSTAAQVRWIGPFVDDTDFKTAETALTIANTDIKISANGGASASKNSGGGTHDVNGMYAVTWDATDTATVGQLKYSVKVAGALQVFGSFIVVEEAVYDALFAASALGYIANATVNVTQLSGDTTAADNAEAFFDGTGYAGTNNVIPLVTTTTTATNVTTVNGLAAGVITAASIAADAITAAKVADGTIDAATFAASAINAAAIAADAITAAKIADGAIDAATFAAGAINAAAIASDAITAAKIADGAIDAATFAASAITSTVLAADAITAAKLHADVTTELQSGLATAAALATVDDFLDTEVAATLAAVLNLVGASYTRTGTAQGGAAGSIDLDTGASSTDDFYNNQLVVIASGTGAGQSRFISDYTGSTRRATVATWVTNPDSTSVFYTIPFGAIAGATAPTAVEVRQEMDNNSTQLAKLGTPAGASISADIAAIEAQTDDIGVAGVGLTAVPWNAAWDAEVQSEVTDALVAYDPPTEAEMNARTLASASYATSAALAVVNGIVDDILLDTAEIGAAGAGLTAIDLPNQTMNITGNITGNLSGTVGSVTGAVGSVTGNVGGVGTGGIAASSFGAGAIDAAAIAADAIGSSELAATAATEIATAVFARAFDATYGSFTFDELVKLMSSVLLGKASGLATTTATYRNLADDANVIVATVDADGNRTAVTRTP